MTRTLSLIALATALAFAPAAFADDKAPERVSHYQGKQANDVGEAIANLREGNARLKELLSGGVSEYDMQDIHNVSYTLEEAVARLREELGVIADDLENMHFYSEGYKRDDVLEYGNAYLNGIERIVK